ncbi:MAG: DUF1344 domain-containing protein [Aestuariivirga sp.]
MKIINLTLMAAVASLVATTAFAANTSISGVIKSVDAPNDSITLVSGTTYILGNEMEAEDFKVGEKVDIVFDTVDGKLTTSSVKAAQ